LAINTPFLKKNRVSLINESYFHYKRHVMNRESQSDRLLIEEKTT